MNVFWHQRDLRIRDNRGLAAAAADDTVVPVFVVDPAVRRAVGDRQWAFWTNGLRTLRGEYRERGSDLLVRVGDPATTLSAVAEEFDADRVYYNEHYRPTRRERQREVDEAVPTEAVTDLVLVDPATLDARYENHSRFYDDWQAREKPAPAPTPGPDAVADISDPQALPDAEADIDLPAPGYDAARARWDRFLADGIESYSDTRDDMAAAVSRPERAVSRVSAYLAAGMLGIRELWADATDRYRAVDGDARRNVDKYRYELSWREQNYNLLYHHPSLPTENYRRFPEAIDWENDPETLAAWKRGETGYPLVDAGMRQLNAEGYIHNRPRQNVASFLTKHLLVDWREGLRYFEQQLLDHDPANNAANWQWTASTGTDSVDVRIFDPVAQLSKYDDGADYVTAYVPELRGVPPGDIVDWPTRSAAERDRLAPEYPDPIVDRNAAYERAQRVFERALGKR
ncbi:cryptochrome/photolyase family protein [Haloarcula onubensis]|uniref:DNA photolyase family protein n=1 Tax=Haloarcula onubensis TaxID=2950539 RepID=A0ABU2FM45_9EURY|nr:deoxyribodipyrimidine photo-lyase [Halomicroarcula sp. S3CR25-11]MDS0281357.1 DNA photolyase family protein [Halomicroarcula sp. S3CR25-11]